MKTEKQQFILGALRFICGVSLFYAGFTKIADMPGDTLLSVETLQFNGRALAAFALTAYPWLCMYAGGFLAIGLCGRFMAAAAAGCLAVNTLVSLFAAGPAAPGCCMLTAYPMPKLAAAALNALMLAATMRVFMKGRGVPALDTWIATPADTIANGRKK